MNLRYSSLALFVGILVFAATGSSYAYQCPAGSVSAAYDPSNNTVTVTADIPGSDRCGGNSVLIQVEGATYGHGWGCPTAAGCTITDVYNTVCFAPGSHLVSGHFGCQHLSSSFCNQGDESTVTTSFSIPDP